VNPTAVIEGVILKLNDRSARPSVHLTIRTDLSDFRWDARKLKDLIDRFLGHVLEAGRPNCPVRMMVHEIRRKADLEDIFSVHPEYWLDVRIEFQTETGCEREARGILEGLGYECSEWIGVEDSESQLGAFHHGSGDTPDLILFVQNHGSRRGFDFLIPVVPEMSLKSQTSRCCN